MHSRAVIEQSFAFRMWVLLGEWDTLRLHHMAGAATVQEGESPLLGVPAASKDQGTCVRSAPPQSQR